MLRIQRVVSALKLNIHFHMLFLDGVQDSLQEQVYPRPRSRAGIVNRPYTPRGFFSRRIPEELCPVCSSVQGAVAGI
jgi:hypothetical protein